MSIFLRSVRFQQAETSIPRKRPGLPRLTIQVPDNPALIDRVKDMTGFTSACSFAIYNSASARAGRLHRLVDRLLASDLYELASEMLL
jgi:hypothetical protein